ncbi:hypothetical protein PG994_003385, partial [Apiospora phragmitis]
DGHAYPPLGVARYILLGAYTAVHSNCSQSRTVVRPGGLQHLIPILAEGASVAVVEARWVLRLRELEPVYRSALGVDRSCVRRHFDGVVYASAIDGLSLVVEGLGEADLSPSSKGFGSNGELIGRGAWVPSTINPENPHRSSVESSFLRNAIPRGGKLAVYAHTRAKRNLFDRSSRLPRAVGVEVEIPGFSYTLNAAKEVIISAGTFSLTAASHGIRRTNRFWITFATALLRSGIQQGLVQSGRSADDGAVFDSKGGYIASEGLRICDASMLSFTISAHPQESMYAMAKKIADNLKTASGFVAV